MERIWFLLISVAIVFFCSVWSVAHGSPLERSGAPLLISPVLSFASPMVPRQALRSAQTIPASPGNPSPSYAIPVTGTISPERPALGGSIFAAIVAFAASGMAVVLFSPLVNHRDGFEFDDPRTVGFVMIALAGTSLGASIRSAIPSRETGPHVLAGLNGVTIRW